MNLDALLQKQGFGTTPRETSRREVGPITSLHHPRLLLQGLLASSAPSLPTGLLASRVPSLGWGKWCNRGRGSGRAV